MLTQQRIIPEISDEYCALIGQLERILLCDWWITNHTSRLGSTVSHLQDAFLCSLTDCWALAAHSSPPSQYHPALALDPGQVHCQCCLIVTLILALIAALALCYMIGQFVTILLCDWSVCYNTALWLVNKNHHLSGCLHCCLITVECCSLHNLSPLLQVWLCGVSWQWYIPGIHNHQYCSLIGQLVIIILLYDWSMIRTPSLSWSTLDTAEQVFSSRVQVWNIFFSFIFFLLANYLYSRYWSLSDKMIKSHLPSRNMSWPNKSFWSIHFKSDKVSLGRFLGR